MIAAAGGIITAAVLVGAIQLVRGAQPAAPALQFVAKQDLDEAVLSLDPAASGAAGVEARQCKTPLAFVTAAVAPGQPPASIRIRSESYLSPSIRIT